MTDHATPNLPSRDFETTARFYAALGFEESYRDEGWMILERGGLTLEFFLALTSILPAVRTAVAFGWTTSTVSLRSWLRPRSR